MNAAPRADLAATQAVCATIAPALNPADLTLCQDGVAAVYWRYYQTQGAQPLSCAGMAEDLAYLAAPGAGTAAQKAVDVFYKIGVENEGNQRFIAMTLAAPATDSDRVGPVGYGTVLAQTAARVALDQPLLKVTLDGIDVGDLANRPPTYDGDMAAAFPGVNMAKDSIGVRGDIEVVTGPIRNTAANRTEIAAVIQQIDAQLGQLETCPVAGGAWGGRETVPPWIDGRMHPALDAKSYQSKPFDSLRTQYNAGAGAAAAGVALPNPAWYAAGNAWQLGATNAYPTANAAHGGYLYNYYGVCQAAGPGENVPGEIAGVADSVQVNFGMRLRDYGSAAMIALMRSSFEIQNPYNNAPPGVDRQFFGDSSTATMIEACTTAVESVVVSSTDVSIPAQQALRAEPDFKGILRAICVSAVAETYATNMAVTGAGPGKDLYGWLPKFNFPDVIRVLPAATRANILAWWNARRGALPGLFVTAMQNVNSFGPAQNRPTRPANLTVARTTDTAVQVLGQWVPSFYSKAWLAYLGTNHTNVRAELAEKLDAVFAPYRAGCRTRYPDEASAAAYGSRVIAANRSNNCWWGPRPQAPVIYTDATNGVIVVVEARPTDALLNKSFHHVKSGFLNNLAAANVPVAPTPGFASQVDLRGFWAQYNLLTSRR
jgi:hypothetical protein